MKGLSLDFLMLLIGNIFLYQIFFWLIDVPGTKKLLGLQTDSLWLYTAYFSFISMFVAYPAVYLIHMAIVRQSLVNIDVKVIVMLIWLSNPVSLYFGIFQPRPVEFISTGCNWIFTHGRGASCDALEMKILSLPSGRFFCYTFIMFNEEEILSFWKKNKVFEKSVE